jgi:hypothetical protein
VKLEVAAHAVILPSADFNGNEKMRYARLQGTQIVSPLIFYFNYTRVFRFRYPSRNQHILSQNTFRRMKLNYYHISIISRNVERG